jgi:hypothetical protein
VKFTLNLPDAILDRTHRRFVIASRSSHTMAVQLASIAFERHKFDLCASKIDSNA